MTEVWRMTYEKDAYTDQLGIKHWAYVVHAKACLTVTGKTLINDGYQDYEGTLEEDEAGRKYMGYHNYIDWHGGRWWIDEDGQFWNLPKPHCVDEQGNPA